MTLGFRECDRLDGVSNFVFWKIRLQIFVEDVDVCEHLEKVI